MENRADSHQGLYVQVTAKRNSSAGLAVRLWTSSGSRTINASDPSQPVRPEGGGDHEAKVIRNNDILLIIPASRLRAFPWASCRWWCSQR